MFTSSLPYNQCLPNCFFNSTSDLLPDVSDPSAQQCNPTQPTMDADVAAISLGTSGPSILLFGYRVNTLRGFQCHIIEEVKMVVHDWLGVEALSILAELPNPY